MRRAKEFLKEIVYVTKDNLNNEEILDGDVHDTIEKVTEAMISFAQYHVKEALKAALNDVRIVMKPDMEYWYEDYVEGINEQSILNAYPSENIK